MTDTLSLILLLAGGYFAFLHFVSPLAVFASAKGPCRYEFPPFDLTETLTNAPDPTKRAIAALGELGFTPVGASRLDMSHSSTGFVLLRKCDDPCLATVSVSSNFLGAISSVEFSQLYEGGGCLSLTNTPMPATFPERPEKIVYRLPKYSDLRSLYSSFITLRAKSPFRYTPISPPEGGALVCLERYCNEELVALCKAGFYSSQCSDGKRGLTLKGAYVMSWKVLWPWKALRLRLAERRTIRALADG